MTLSQVNRWLRRIAAAALLVMVLAAVLWWHFTGWAPARSTYPIQGVAISEADGAVKWPTLATLGTDFAYIRASLGADRRDVRYADNALAAAQAGIRQGAVHDYSLCAMASEQAALFVTIVPRSQDALPPAINLEFDERCRQRPARDLLLSELNTFLNQIEAHFGQPALLRITPDFEERYRISAGLARNVWLTRNRFEPDYAAKSWEIWEANQHYRMQGAPGALHWIVARPAKDSAG